MKTYLTRSLRYLIQLLLLIAVVYAVLYLTGYAAVDLPELFATWRGWVLVGMIVVLAAAYPSYGYAGKLVKADYEADRDKIVRAMDMGGYGLAGERDGEMVFHKQNALKRIISIGQDTVRVTRDGDYVVVSGLRKEVVKVDYRLRSMIE